MLQNLFSRSYAGNLPKLYLYAFFANFYVLLPIWGIFLMVERGLTVSQVTLSDIAFVATMALAEIPTGAVADVFGRRKSMMVFALMSIGALFIFATATSFTAIMAANSLWAIGMSFNSGAEAALFYESLKVLGREGEYAALRGKMSSINIAALAVSSLLGGWIAEIDLQLPFFIYMGSVGVALALVYFIQEPPFETEREDGGREPYGEIVKLAWRAAVRRPNLRYALLYASLLPLTAILIEVLFIQLYAGSVGVAVGVVGVIVFGYQMAALVGSANAGRVQAKWGEWGVLRIAPVLVVMGTLALGALPFWGGVGLFAMTSMATAVARPTYEGVMLREAPASVRATILSLASLVGSVFYVLVELRLGVMSEQVGFQPAFLALAAVVGLGLAVTLGLWGRVWTQSANGQIATGE